MVGTGGGVPSARKDIVVSAPRNRCDGVMLYNYWDTIEKTEPSAA